MWMTLRWLLLILILMILMIIEFNSFHSKPVVATKCPFRADF